MAATSAAQMNGYGVVAMQHMAQYLPARYSTLADPVSYFLSLGEEVAAEINTAVDAWAARQAAPPDEATRNMIRLAIEEQILAESVYLTPEDLGQEPAIDNNGGWTGPSPAMGHWEPILGCETGPEDLDDDVTRR